MRTSIKSIGLGRRITPFIIYPLLIALASMFASVIPVSGQPMSGTPAYYKAQLKKECKMLDDAQEKLADAVMRQSIGNMYFEVYGKSFDSVSKLAMKDKVLTSFERAAIDATVDQFSLWADKRDAASDDVSKLKKQIKELKFFKKSAKIDLKMAEEAMKKPGPDPSNASLPPEEKKKLDEDTKAISGETEKIVIAVNAQVGRLTELGQELKEIVNKSTKILFSKDPSGGKAKREKDGTKEEIATLPGDRDPNPAAELPEKKVKKNAGTGNKAKKNNGGKVVTLPKDDKIKKRTGNTTKKKAVKTTTRKIISNKPPSGGGLLNKLGGGLLAPGIGSIGSAGPTGKLSDGAVSGRLKRNSSTSTTRKPSTNLNRNQRGGVPATNIFRKQ